MNYLGKNLNNSSNLPYDETTEFNIFADPLFAVRKQIENGDYDLDEIMYKRMKKYMLKNCIDDTRFRDYTLENNGDCIFLNERNIDDKIYKDAILNWNCGYKDYFLQKHKQPTSLCGLNPFQNVIDLEDCVDKNLVQNILCNYRYHSDGCFEKYYIKELFAVWRTIE
jgi:hypothetical protein